MKNILLAAMLLAVMAAAVQAQVVVVDSNRQTRYGSLNVRSASYSYSASYYGFGLSYGYGGYGYPGCFSYYHGGCGVPVNGMPMTAPCPLYGPPGTFYSGYGLYSYGTPYGLYGGGGGAYYGGMPGIESELPPPPRKTDDAEKLEKLSSSKQIDLGRFRFRAGDYRGALDEFRQAVVADPSAAAQAHFAIALVVAGDLKNADKALRGAVDKAPFGKIDFTGLFPNEKEKARVLAALQKVSGDGSLAAAFALQSMGVPEPLQKQAEKDPLAKKFLP